MKTMSGEDTLFMLDLRKSSRLIMIRQLYGKDVVEQTIDKLKGVVYEQD